jgi:hypothetical protein
VSIFPATSQTLRVAWNRDQPGIPVIDH